MRKNNLIKKGMVVAVILLFFSVSVIPSTDICAGNINCNNPPTAPIFLGPTRGVVGEYYHYTINSTDSDGDDVYYLVAWEPDVWYEWFGPYPSGEEINIGHTWDERGTYYVISQAMDIYNSTSAPTLLEVIIGEIIYVYNGIYYENVIVNKSINLMGENKKTTRIWNKLEYNGCCVKITGDIVNLSEFGITNSSSSEPGIDVRSSKNCIINNCSIFNNSYIGIMLYSSDYIEVENCHISNNYKGIYFHNSNYNTITNNILINNGIDLRFSENNNFSGNIVNNKPLVYLEKKSYKNIDEAGQVVLVDCTNIIIKNQNLSNATIGLILYNTHNCQIESNTFTNNRVTGISILQSRENIVINNTMESNLFFGINIGFQSYNNRIYSNIIRDNNIGIAHSHSNGGHIYKNEIIGNKNHGIIISHGKENNISMNKILNNTWYGISLYDVSNSIITENIINNNSRGGLLVHSSTDIFIESNYLNDSSNKSVDGLGIILMLANHNTISQNHILGNNIGISLANSSYNYISHNHIQNNLGAGIESWVENSCYNTIIKNLIGNNLFGIYFKTNYNKIIKNNIINNKIQAFFKDCNNTWNENYWNRMRFLPKPLFGIKTIETRLGINIPLPWLEFDMNPAQEPFPWTCYCTIY